MSIKKFRQPDPVTVGLERNQVITTQKQPKLALLAIYAKTHRLQYHDVWCGKYNDVLGEYLQTSCFNCKKNSLTLWGGVMHIYGFDSLPFRHQGFIRIHVL